MVPGIIAIISLSCLAGIVMYAFYAKCDPIKFGLIEKADQVCYKIKCTVDSRYLEFQGTL